MAYIDVDKFAEKICNFQAIDEDCANKMIWLLRTFPTADVVPRAEVAKIFEEIEAMIYKVLNNRHYIMGDMCYEFAELRKKYTEDSADGKRTDH